MFVVHLSLHVAMQNGTFFTYVPFPFAKAIRIPMILFQFPFPIVAQKLFHSHGNTAFAVALTLFSKFMFIFTDFCNAP